MDKKPLIIQAFENLDAEMLDVLLNDEFSYQDVPKMTFVERLKDYFDEIKTYENVKFNFKAYKGNCLGCQKGKTGISFVNSEGECYMSLIFEESENDFSDIYKCGSFSNDNIEIVNEWNGIYFYDDESADFVHSFTTLKEQQQCNTGVAEIEKEAQNNGVLYSQFYLKWYEKYLHFDPIGYIFNKKNYKYAVEIGNYYSTVSAVAHMFKKNEVAKSYLTEFTSFSLICEASIKDWLIKADQEFGFAKYGFDYEINFKQDFFEGKYFKFCLSELYYYQNISEILTKYSDWIPEINQLERNDSGEDYDESDYPF